MTWRRLVLALSAGALALGASAPTIIPPASAATTSAFVRVNLVGYAAALPKSAYLMSSVAETGATFAVKDSGGNTVLSGPVGASAGKWSKDYTDVYPLDFSSSAMHADPPSLKNSAVRRH